MKLIQLPTASKDFTQMVIISRPDLWSNFKFAHYCALFVLFELFKIVCLRPDTNYLFMGDYVDRGI